MAFLEIYPQLPWRPNLADYDCSNRTAEEWAARGTAHPIMGGFAIVSGFIILVLYLLVLTAMSHKEYLKHPCYQMMYFTLANDILNLLGSNFATGYFMIVGGTFCTHPISNYLIGSLGISVWCSDSLAVLSLGLGRLSEVTGYGKFMYEGRMTILWVILSFLYFLFTAIMTRPLLFNSTAGTWIPAPFITDNLEEELNKHKNVMMPINHFLFPLLIAITYICLFVTLMKKKQSVKYVRKSSTAQKKADQKYKLLLQCTVICLSQAFVGFWFFCLIVFPMPHWFLVAAQGAFQLNECLPPIVCLVFNRKIRKRVRAMLGLQSSAVGGSFAARNE